MWTKVFWRAAFERAVKSAAQAALIVGGGDLVEVWNMPLSGMLGVALAGGIVSILTSVASDAATGSGPSAMNAEVLPYKGKHAAPDEGVAA